MFDIIDARGSHEVHRISNVCEVHSFKLFYRSVTVRDGNVSLIAEFVTTKLFRSL